MIPAMFRARLAILCFLLPACAVSRFHLGVQNLDEKNRPTNLVGQRWVKDLSAVEAYWVKTLIAGDIEALRPVMAPKLSEALDEALVKKTSDKILKAFGPTGYYEIVPVGAPFFYLQKGVKKNAFEHYDLIGTAFTLEGKVESSLRLYVTQVDGKPRLCGFEIYPKNEGDQEMGKEVRLVFPEKSHPR